MRKFEKISFKQYKKDVDSNEKNYESYKLPMRSTKNSSGYDFFLLNDFILKPGEKIVIPTGIKACMDDDNYLAIYIRSSLGFKYDLALCNQVGIIDSDYYNNRENEGHIMIAIRNNGKEKVILSKDSAFIQGIFQKYEKTFDDISYKVREGGIGSTSRRKENER